MQHSDVIKWMEQIEDSLIRAETAKKDIDLIVLLRLAYRLAKEKEKELRDDTAAN